MPKGKVIHRMESRSNLKRGVDPEENEIINPFHSRFDIMMLQDSEGGIGHIPLDSTCSSQTLDRDVLDIDTAFPEDEEVLLVTRNNRGVSVHFRDIQGSSLSAIWAGRDLSMRRGNSVTYICIYAAKK